MSVEENKNVVNQVFAALDRRELDAVVSYYRPGTHFHGWAPQTVDLNSYKVIMSGLLAAFPDSRFLVEDIIAEGDRVAVRHTFSGTHQQTFQGVPASGRKVEAGAIAILRMEDGKAAELWLNADFLGILQQIGAVPTQA